VRTRSLALFSVLLTLILVLAACGTGSSSSPAGDGADGGDTSGGETGGGDAGGETVSLAGGQFSPTELTIAAGTTVTFTNTANHTVTEGSDGEAVDDPIVDEDGGEDITVTFDEPGTYQITCRIHPSMNMTVTVEG
jgi:plastocyanin